MNLLHQPLTIKSIIFPNRIGMSPMCQYSSTDGFSAPWHLVHYGSRAVGGVGMIMLEASAVVPEGRITPHDLGIWKDEHIFGLKQITDFIHEQGSIAGIQIAHAGRKASHDAPKNGGKQLSSSQGGWDTVAPSSIAFDPTEKLPKEMTLSDIKRVIDQFRNAAKRSCDAGFKVLEIHAAHGYLVHEFLSPLSNTRKDEYGGSFENRSRLLIEIVDTVIEVWPSDLPLFVRISATDWAENGWDIEESIQLSKLLKNKGIDLIDCSSGGNIISAQVPLEMGYQVRFAEAIRQTGILTAAVGLITTKEQINEILQTEKADLIFLGRELLRNPYFCMSNVENQPWKIQYSRAK